MAMNLEGLEHLNGYLQVPIKCVEMYRRVSGMKPMDILSTLFDSLTTTEKQVSFAYDLLKENDLLPSLTVISKNDKKSRDFRKMANEELRQKKYKEAHRLYTESLRWAEPGNRNVALAYAKRSSVLLHIGLFEECLRDIEMALRNYCADKLKFKLQYLQYKATEMQHTQVKIQFNTDVPSIPECDRNPLIQSASQSVRIERSEFYGRQVVAAKDIEPGEIIAVEKSFCHILTDQPETHCHHCLNLCYNLISCSECTVALFCSETCQAQAYEQYHQYECRLLPILRDIDLDDRSLALRLTILATSQFQNVKKWKTVKDDVYRSDRFEEIYNLERNASNQSLADLFNLATHAASIFHLMKTYTNYFTSQGKGCEKSFKGLLLHFMQVGPFRQIVENKLSGPSKSLVMEGIGLGVFPFNGMFNHSCYPNVTAYFYGTTIVMIALEPIKTGDQCFVNYVNDCAVMPKTARMSSLKKLFFFDCTCIACTNNFPLYAPPKKHGRRHRKRVPIGETLKKAKLSEVDRRFKEFRRKMKYVSDKRLDPAVTEIREALKLCCSNFAAKTTPIYF